MRSLRSACWLALLAITLNTCEVYGQSLFKKAMTEHLKLKSVSCSACHIAGKPKTNRNDFGKLFEKELKGKNVSKRLKDAVVAADKAKVETAVKKEFIEALKKVVEKEFPGGGTYGEAIKKAKIKGIEVNGAKSE